MANPRFDSNKTLTARDIMATSLFTLREDQDVNDAIDGLLERRISGCPVLDANDRLVGVMSEKDCILALVRAFYHKLPSGTVADVMSKQVRSIPPSMDLLSIAQLFLQNHFRRLPVVDGEHLVGQISRRDLLTAISKVLRTNPHHEAATLYLSAIDAPPPID